VRAIHLGFAGIVPPFAAMLPGNAIRSIKTAQFATGVRTILCSAINLTVFPPILTPIKLTILSSIFSPAKLPIFTSIFTSIHPAIFLPHIAGLGK
jgi:hypothetical protein